VRLSENLSDVAGYFWPLAGAFRRSHRAQIGGAPKTCRHCQFTKLGAGRGDIVAGFASPLGRVWGSHEGCHSLWPAHKTNYHARNFSGLSQGALGSVIGYATSFREAVRWRVGNKRRTMSRWTRRVFMARRHCVRLLAPCSRSARGDTGGWHSFAVATTRCFPCLCVAAGPG
jgi:hypothetical protein